jgi:O-acetyl-ADP-ribose deacetylase (regulator of RNase III)
MNRLCSQLTENPGMKIFLADLSSKLTEAWREFFEGEDNVTIVEADITRLECDAVVSPANSFGFMDGGLDYALSERFGWDLEKKLQQQIRDLPMGELLIGESIVIETGDSTTPFLISAPTMRIPTNFNIDTSVNAYLAMKAILIAAGNEEKITSLAIPGLCTGVGRMQPIIAARQMFQAYKEIILGQKMNFSEFGQSQKYHWNINPQGMIWTH